MPFEALPYVTITGLFFGSTLVVSRFSVGQYDALTYIGLRLALASLAHLVTYWLVVKRPFPSDRQLWRHGVLFGILGMGVPMSCIVLSLEYQSSGVTSLLLTTNPAVTVLLAHFLLTEENLSRRKIAGVILALSGALLLAVKGESGLANVHSVNLTGYGLIAISILASSSMTIYARKHLRGYDAFDVASVRMVSGAVAVLPLSFIVAGFDLHRVTQTGYVALVYAAFGTFAGMILAFYNIKHFGATAAAMVSYTIPIVAGVGGVLVLHEAFSRTMLVGMVIIIAGIALVQQRGAALVAPPQSPVITSEQPATTRMI